jgi:hypothetical protein
MLMAPFNVHKMVEIHHKKNSITSLNIFFQIFNFFGIRFIISKMSIFFKNMFNVGIVYGFKVGVIKIIHEE